LRSARSARPTTDVSALALLFVVDGSGVLLVTVPPNCKLVPGSTPGATATTNGRFTACPGSSTFVVVSVTVPSPLSVANHPVGSVALSNVVLGGSVTVTTVPLAADGPRFVTVAVTVAVCPPVAVGVETNPSARSADGLTGVVKLVALFAGFGSLVALLTPARFTRLVVTVAATVPTIVTVAEPPAGSVPMTHGNAVQPPWLELMLVTVKPAGSVSVTTTACAADGPAFATVKM